MGAYVVCRWVYEVTDEPVGDVDVGFSVFGSGVLLEDGADGYMQSGDCLVFDSVAGVRVVFHYLAGSALSFDVYLEEDCVAGTGHSYAVLFDEAVYCAGVEDCPEEGDEVAVKMMAYAPEDYVFREGA